MHSPAIRSTPDRHRNDSSHRRGCAARLDCYCSATTVTIIFVCHMLCSPDWLDRSSRPNRQIVASGLRLHNAHNRQRCRIRERKSDYADNRLHQSPSAKRKNPHMLFAEDGSVELIEGKGRRLSWPGSRRDPRISWSSATVKDESRKPRCRLRGPLVQLILLRPCRSRGEFVVLHREWPRIARLRL